jgi:hypothetical protein
LLPKKNKLLTGEKMSRESRIFTINSANSADAQAAVSELESFGWELLSVKGNQVFMSRETQNSVYTDLVKYEYRYNALQAERAALREPPKPNSYSAFICIVLFLLLIAPLVFYIRYKIRCKKDFEARLAEYYNTHARLTAEIAQVCQDSRAVFFSRQI